MAVENHKYYCHILIYIFSILMTKLKSRIHKCINTHSFNFNDRTQKQDWQLAPALCELEESKCFRKWMDGNVDSGCFIKWRIILCRAGPPEARWDFLAFRKKTKNKTEWNKRGSVNQCISLLLLLLHYVLWGLPNSITAPFWNGASIGIGVIPELAYILLSSLFIKF